MNKKIIISLVLVLALVFGVIYLATAPKEDVKVIKNEEVVEKNNEVKEEPEKEEIKKETVKNKEVQKEEVKKDTPVLNKEVKKEEVKEEKLLCSLEINCLTALNYEGISPEIKSILPENGIILKKDNIEFKEGQTVFDILANETKKNKIHMEYENTPMYDSCYIEGINNLYEFDCGELSGWMYRVNGVFPNYGCGKYYLKNGDKIEFLYTVDLGKDLGAPIN